MSLNAPLLFSGFELAWLEKLLPVGSKVPIGKWTQEFVSFLTNHFDTEFRTCSETLGAALGAVVSFLGQCNPTLAIVSVSLTLLLLSRSWKLTLGSFAGLFLILNLGYWQETLETLALVTGSTLISTAAGIPLGILCAHHPRLYRLAQPVLDLMQTIPTFVYLIPTLMLFGLGLAPGVISTVIFAMPAPIRLTYLGISQVPQSLTEVADAFGASAWQKLWQVEIPYALPSIRAGISQCVMLSLSMVVIAALVGADGLGKPVIQALNTVDVAKGFEAGLSIVILAILLDRILMIKRTPVQAGSH